MKKTLLVLAGLLLVGAGCTGANVELEDESKNDTVMEEAMGEEGETTVEEKSESEEITPIAMPVPGNEATDEMVVEESPEDGLASQEAQELPEPVSEVKVFTVAARQWEFDPSVITVNRGDTVRLIVSSVDVDHGIAIPAFDVSERLTPGNTVTVEFVADQPGSFTFFCNVFCGSGHGGMKGTLVVN